jgi:hypothetical protein
LIVDRIKALNLPAGQFVVIGSGVMDALGLRAAHDIDLVVTPEYFATLKQAGGWMLAKKHGEEVLTHGALEVWLSWGSHNGQPNFSELYDNGLTIDGIRFTDPTFVRDWKVEHNRPKDRADIAILNEYLDRN